MSTWTRATPAPSKITNRTTIGQHRAPKKPPVSQAPEVDVWANYASGVKKATGAFVEEFASFLCIPPVHFVGGVACIPAGGMVSVTGRSGLGFANSMMTNGVPDAIARAWEDVVSSAVSDFFRSFQICLTYPSFVAHPTPFARPTPNVPVPLSQGFSGAIHLVLAPILTCSLQAKLAPFASDKSDAMKSATAGYAAWFADRFELAMRSIPINNVMAEGPVLGQFVGPVKAHLTAPVGFITSYPIAVYFTD